jgi:hypothetical protein
VATGWGQDVHDARFRSDAINHRAGESMLQGLSERSGVWKLMHQSAVYLSEADRVYVALRRALKLVSIFALDIRLVSYGTPTSEILSMVEEFE